MKMSEWISIHDKDAPPMESVLLLVGDAVIMGWNESVFPEENASYCTWRHFYSSVEMDKVSHWMPLPKPPGSDNTNYDA